MNDVLYTKQLPDKEGFQITFYALVENTPLQGQFALDTEEETKRIEQETIDNINSGKWVYFCAKVTSSKCNVELASDYLGCCIYKTYDSFCNPTYGYITDMINTVVSQAKEKIKELNQ